MTTTHPEFDRNTEALEVARAFSDSIHGKTILITGVNRGGIGYTTAQAFASQQPAHLIIAGRNPSRVQDCIDALKAEYPNVGYRPLPLDLSNQKAVRASAATLLSWSDIPTIDILINNAAVMNLPTRQLTEEGIELTFATNHIGHFLFTCLIMSKLHASTKSNTPQKGTTRIINVTSLSPTASQGMRWSDMTLSKINKTLPETEQPNYTTHRWFGAVNPEEQSYLPLEGYNQSKVANLLFSIALTNRLYESHGILSLACHPGIIKTELSRYASSETTAAIAKILANPEVHVKTLGAGAATSLVSATDPGLGRPMRRMEDGKENVGAFFADCQVCDRATPGASSSSEAEKLWALSEGLVGESFAW